MIITETSRNAVVDLYAPCKSDYPLLKTGGLFWQLSDEVEQWLGSSFAPETYEVRLNDMWSDVSEYERAITHHTYIVFHGYNGVTPLQQAMLFKLAWNQ